MPSAQQNGVYLQCHINGNLVIINVHFSPYLYLDWPLFSVFCHPQIEKFVGQRIRKLPFNQLSNIVKFVCSLGEN